MTTVVHKTYGYSTSGFGRYAFNRFLRLYPSYWIAILLSAGVILYCGGSYISSYRSTLYLPSNFAQVAENASMVFPGSFPSHVFPRLSPPTWALTVELFYYALIGLGVSKTVFRTRAWIVISALYVVYTFVVNAPYEYRYANIFAGSLPFSIGSYLFFEKDRLYQLVRSRLTAPPNLMAAQIALFGIFSAIEHVKHDALAKNIGIYLDIFVMSALVLRLDRDGLPMVSRRVDKRIGDFSYPIYLLHWQLGALASYLLFRRPALGFTGAAALSWGLALVLVLATSSLLVFWVDPAIERLRNAVRSSSSNGPPGSYGRAIAAHSAATEDASGGQSGPAMGGADPISALGEPKM